MAGGIPSQRLVAAFAPDHGAVGLKRDQSRHFLVLVCHHARRRRSNSQSEKRVWGGEAESHQDYLGGYEGRRRKAEMTVVARGLGVTSEGFRARERK